MEGINKKTVAMNVRVARAKKGYSLEQLSKASGVGVTTLSFVENAKTEFRLTTIDKIARALEVTLEDIIS